MIFELNPVRWFSGKAGAAAAAPVAAARNSHDPAAVKAQVMQGIMEAAPHIIRASVRAAQEQQRRNPLTMASGAGQVKVQYVRKAAVAEESVMAGNKFIGFLESIGKLFAKGLGFAVQYAIPVEKLIALLFPAAAPAALGVATATQLIQNAVIAVEQKYAAAGVQNGTGSQKAAEVLTLTEQAVIALLKQDGITADTTYVQSIISAVVGMLNVHTAPAAAPPASAV